MKLPRASAVVSTVFGIGYFPQAQGTIMSAIALPLGILIGLRGGGAMGLLGASLIVLVIGILACAEYVRETGNPDPSECVIDELAGQWLASAFIALAPFSLFDFILSFVLFRLFDIWKPWPVYLAETKLHGGLAVMMDDIVAGLMAGALSLIIRHYTGL
jgi:phosphatidylglycerophosphatase A